MLVRFQDCGCIALPDEIVAAMGLSAGSILEITHEAGSKVAAMTAEGSMSGGKALRLGGSCRIRTAGS